MSSENATTRKNRKPADMEKATAGIDLHCNNPVVGIMGLDGKGLANRKLPGDLEEVELVEAAYSELRVG